MVHISSDIYNLRYYMGLFVVICKVVNQYKHYTKSLYNFPCIQTDMYLKIQVFIHDK